MVKTYFTNTLPCSVAYRFTFSSVCFDEHRIWLRGKSGLTFLCTLAREIGVRILLSLNVHFRNYDEGCPGFKKEIGKGLTFSISWTILFKRLFLKFGKIHHEDIYLGSLTGCRVLNRRRNIQIICFSCMSSDTEFLLFKENL